jgi:cyclophilin family peptidyl-prolyl cis-trans isomerase
MTRPLALLLACLLLCVFAACGDDEEPAATGADAGATETAEPDAAETATATPEDTGGEQATGCKPAEKAAPEAKQVDKPKGGLDPAKTYVATVKTNCGTFAITLDAERAPKTGGSFKALADAGFYDGLAFHRIVPGFVIQGGDPQGDGSGGPGYAITEAPPADLAYTKGVVAMAKTQIEDPGTSGSQFFVVTGADAQLPPDYALLGTVTEGQDVVDLIGVAPVGADEQPVEPIVMESVKVTEG